MTKKALTLEGLPIRDAVMPLILEVEKGDIRNQDRKDPQNCAIARACQRTMHTEARVYLSRLYLKQGDVWLRYELSEVIRSELMAFDRGGGFSTGTYRISPMRPSHRSGEKSQGSRGGARTGNGTPHTWRRIEGVRPCSPLNGGTREQPPVKVAGADT